MNQLIIKIESGVVADIWHSGQLDVTVVDYDVIEGGDSFEALVAECERPFPRQMPGGSVEKQAA